MQDTATWDAGGADLTALHRALSKILSYADTALAAVDGADAVCLVTHWPEFATIDLEAVKSRLKTPCLVDLRNVYDPQSMTAKGWNYRSLGRPS